MLSSFFSIFYLAAVIFIILSSKSLIHSVLLPPLFCCWFLSIKCSSLFVCSVSFINIYCMIIIIFPRSWIIFSIIFWFFFFPGRFPISSSFSCFSVFVFVFSCSFIWKIKLCFFILINYLWLWFLFWRLKDCSRFNYLQQLHILSTLLGPLHKKCLATCLLFHRY